MGVKFTVNFETGFILREGTYQNPVYAGASTSNLQQGSVTDCMYEIVQNIVDAGVKLNTYNAQSLNGNSLLVRPRSDTLVQAQIVSNDV